MHKKPEKHFNLDDSRFYTAEVLSALQHIHSLSYVHRDVKPENILVAATGHIMISDFGSVKDMSGAVLEGQPVSPATDLWALGVVIYQFLTGRHAFHDESEYLIYKRIQKLLFSYPPEFPETAKDLIDRLLVIKPEYRLGTTTTGGPEALRYHKFFEEIDWDNLALSKPPTIPV
ncbi:unnamed protein product [Nippostrongylus brasiliensis]|uniref:non-specific serine/threonine protein kinase n=1 Tax=Nippostrongylus brasiliensis TaxID=27835 RepID=A0A0N4YIA9_NIPBR|nr:unnamed protein product [Nippostrongylus brasiliensis]